MIKNKYKTNVLTSQKSTNTSLMKFIKNTMSTNRERTAKFHLEVRSSIQSFFLKCKKKLVVQLNSQVSLYKYLVKILLISDYADKRNFQQFSLTFFEKA